MEIRSDGSEKVKYDYDSYYAYIRQALLSTYPNYAADSHWHDDLEFIYIISGSMKYNVNGKVFTINEGDGIFVNARQLHYGFSNKKDECDFICVLLHPLLICASPNIDRDYVAPFIADESVPCVLLKKNIKWQEQILIYIKDILDKKNKVAAPLYIQSIFYNIWILLVENAFDVKNNKGKTDAKLSVLKNMLGYIQKNYQNRITLGDIASAGNMSKSACLLVFKRYLNDTPNNYLVGYRLKKAAGLLTETDMSITEIAFCTGFGGLSYFSEIFKRNYGVTPGVYRKCELS